LIQLNKSSYNSAKHRQRLKLNLWQYRVQEFLDLPIKKEK
ncbi:MAG: hypothetical protein ACI8XC_003468, partial [Gammaproteobacteria bacterium]